MSSRAARFIHPKAEAIVVSAVSGLVIASRKIEGVEPLGILLMSLVRSAPEQRRVWGTR